MPEETPIEPDDVLGIDTGVKNIAVDNTGTTFSNEKVEAVRKRVHKHRASLQSKATIRAVELGILPTPQFHYIQGKTCWCFGCLD